MSFVFFGTIYLVLVKISTSTSTIYIHVQTQTQIFMSAIWIQYVFPQFPDSAPPGRPGMVNLNVFSDKTKTKLFKSKAAGPVYEYFDK